MSAIKQAEKTWPTKTILDQNKIDMEGLFDPGLFNMSGI